MKIAVTPFNVASISELSKNGADIFIIGNEEYANRLVISFSNSEITEANYLIKSLNKEIYINLNLIIHNNDLDKFLEFLHFVKELNVDGIIFGDLAVYQMARKVDLSSKLIYSPETLNTNYYDPIFWGNKGIKGLTISKEITLEEITIIAKNSDIEISLIGHGHLNMFHSRRPLIENYFKYTNIEYDKQLENRNLRLVEEIRDESYPVFQDSHGTHIFREKAMESYQEVNILKELLNVFIIDSIFKDTKYLLDTLKNYSEILTNPNYKEISKALSKKYEKNHDSGFLYK
ncbi:MAG: U32 family peptidase, partial [Candidatus Izimaplasma sp.]|nr:U32 family peptidase [Candidatus Izimaplasma bacterium]